jgi:hypothetical protein
MVAATPISQAIFNFINSFIDKNTVASVSYVWVETVAYAICGILLIFFTVENNLEEDQKNILKRQKEAVLASGGVWIEPEERLRLEQEEALRIEEEARIKELKDYCLKHGLDFDTEEEKYQKNKSKK